MRRIVTRVAQSLLTIFVVISITFGLIRLLPGGPVDYLKSRMIQQNPDVSSREINALVETYSNVRPGNPLPVQYFNYMTSIITGDFGKSLLYGSPASDILGEALPWTLFLMGTALIISFLLSVILGSFMAYYEGSNFDFSLSVGSIFFQSVPYYIAGLFLLYVLSFQMGLFPTGGKVDPNTTPGFNIPFLTGLFYHAALPIISLVLTGINPLAMRGNAISVLGSDYIQVAKLRGISERRIALRYVARNAILPFYTGFLISIGTMFGGSVILEQIFSYEGIGYYLFESISARDYPLMMGGFILITIAVVIGILIADLTYGKIDPRASDNGTQSEAY